MRRDIPLDDREKEIHSWLQMLDEAIDGTPTELFAGAIYVIVSPTEDGADLKSTQVGRTFAITQGLAHMLGVVLDGTEKHPSPFLPSRNLTRLRAMLDDLADAAHELLLLDLQEHP